MFRSRLGYQAGDIPVPEAGYRLVEFLGEGQFGEVWKAEAPGGQVEVAVKIIDLTRVEGEREFSAIQHLKSVHSSFLVGLHACWAIDKDGCVIDPRLLTAPLHEGAQGGADKTLNVSFKKIAMPTRLVVAMDLGEKCLHKLLQEHRQRGVGGIPPEELIQYMKDAARGIDYLHEPIHYLAGRPCPIVHRDIKPHNILVVGGGARVCDFGLARAVENLQGTVQQSQSANLVGTIAYMAPELFQKKRATPASDQYALAITYAQLRRGALPYDDGDHADLFQVMEHAKHGNHNLSGLGEKEQEVLRRALDPNLRQRFATCKEMVSALEEAIRGPAVPPPPVVVDPNDAGSPSQSTSPVDKSSTEPEPPRPAPTPSPRTWPKAVFWVLVLLGIVCASGYVFVPAVKQAVDNAIRSLWPEPVPTQVSIEELLREWRFAEAYDAAAPDFHAPILARWWDAIGRTWRGEKDLPRDLNVHEECTFYLDRSSGNSDVLLMQAWSSLRSNDWEHAAEEIDKIPHELDDPAQKALLTAFQWAIAAHRADSNWMSEDAKTLSELKAEYEKRKAGLPEEKSLWKLDSANDEGYRQWLYKTLEITDSSGQRSLIESLREMAEDGRYDEALDGLKDEMLQRKDDVRQQLRRIWAGHQRNHWPPMSPEGWKDLRNWASYWDKFPDASDQTQRLLYIRALVCLDDPLAKVELAKLPSNGLRKQDEQIFRDRMDLVIQCSETSDLYQLANLATLLERAEKPISDSMWKPIGEEKSRFDAAANKVTAAVAKIRQDQMAEAERLAVENIRGLIASKKFPDAVRELESPKLSATVHSELSTELRDKWFVHLQGKWNEAVNGATQYANVGFGTIGDDCDSLLRFAPECTDAYLLRARCVSPTNKTELATRLNDYNSRVQDKIPAETKDLCELLDFLGKHGMSGPSELPPEATSELNSLLEKLSRSSDSSGAAAFWTPREFEKDAIRAWEPKPKPKPADESKKLADVGDLIGKRDYKTAIAKLKLVDKAKLSDDANRTCAALEYVANGWLFVSSDPLNVTELESRYDEFEKVAKGADKNANLWTDESPECERRKELGRTLSDKLIGLAKDELDNQQIAAAQNDRDPQNIKAALDALELAGRLTPTPKPEIKFLHALLTLSDSAVPVAEPLGVLKDIEIADLDQARELADSLKLLLLPDRKGMTTTDLDLALTVLRSPGSRLHTYMPELRSIMGDLWKARIALRIAEEAEPNQEELQLLEDDWKWVTQREFQSRLVNSWRMEGILVTGGEAADAYNILLKEKPVPAPDGHASYREYVSALLAAKSDSPEWDTVLAHLDAVRKAADKEPTKSILNVQGRLARAAGLIVDGEAASRHIQSPFDSPFASPEAADQQRERLLWASRQLGKNEQRRAEADLGLALAAYYGKTPDYGAVWTAVAGCCDKIPATDPNAMAFGAVCARAFAEDPNPPKDAATRGILACATIVEQLDKASDVKDLTKLEELIAPVVRRAREIRADKSDAVPAEAVERLFGSVARFKFHQKFASAFGGTRSQVAAEVEKLLNDAIALHESAPDPNNEALAEYRIVRGYARLKQLPPKLKQARSDAEYVRDQLGLESSGANGLLCSCAYRQAWQVQDYSQLLASVDEAIEVGKRAADGDKSSPFYEETLDNLISAYIWRANYVRDLSFKSQKDDLDEALVRSKQWMDIARSNPHFPFLGEGNALEDLAWLVESEPKANYKEAILAFGQAAISESFQADARCAIGRCYLKAIAFSQMAPTDLDFATTATTEDVLKEALTQLDLAETADPTYAATYLQRARVRQQLALYDNANNNLTLADGDLTKAKDLAAAQQLSDRVYYVAAWAWAPLNDVNLTQAKRHETAIQRAKDLKLAPRFRNFDGKCEAARIKMKTHAEKLEINEALEVLSDKTLFKKTPDGDLQTDWSHVDLLLDRAELRGILIAKKWNWEQAWNALDDASRAIELAHEREKICRGCDLATAFWTGLVMQHPNETQLTSAQKQRRVDWFDDAHKALEDGIAASRETDVETRKRFLKRGAELLRIRAGQLCQSTGNKAEIKELQGQAKAWLKVRVELETTPDKIAQAKGDMEKSEKYFTDYLGRAKD